MHWTRTLLNPQCRDQRAECGDSLADLVVPLAYVEARMTPTRHQSEHHMYAYKRTPPVEKCANDLALMILGGSILHGECIARAAGVWWGVITFVPSAKRPGADHPAAQLARQVVDFGHGAQRVGLDLGPSGADSRRAVLADRFVVPDEWRTTRTSGR